MIDEIMLSTYLQALFVDADYHLSFFTLHTEADAQNALVLLWLSVFPGPVIKEGGQRQLGQALRHGWREGKGETGVPQSSSCSWMRTGVTQDGELWRQHALQRIHHIWKSHSQSLMRRILQAWKLHMTTTIKQFHNIMLVSEQCNISHEQNN